MKIRLRKKRYRELLQAEADLEKINRTLVMATATMMDQGNYHRVVILRMTLRDLLLQMEMSGQPNHAIHLFSMGRDPHEWVALAPDGDPVFDVIFGRP